MACFCTAGHFCACSTRETRSVYGRDNFAATKLGLVKDSRHSLRHYTVADETWGCAAVEVEVAVRLVAAVAGEGGGAQAVLEVVLEPVSSWPLIR